MTVVIYCEHCSVNVASSTAYTSERGILRLCNDCWEYVNTFGVLPSFCTHEWKENVREMAMYITRQKPIPHGTMIEKGLVFASKCAECIELYRIICEHENKKPRIRLI